MVIKHVLSPRLQNLPLDKEREFLNSLEKHNPLPPHIKVQRLALNQISAEILTHPKAPSDQAILYFHGGAYNLGSCNSHRGLAAAMAQATQMQVLFPEYRLAPEFPFPAALDDALSAYQYLVNKGIPAKNIILMGDSAGGGLAIACAIALKDKGQAAPRALICFSPWVDLNHRGESIQSHADKDPVLTLQILQKHAKAYVADSDAQNPLISPLYADLKDLPPMLIQVGEMEILLSDSTRLAESARNAGVNVTLQVWPGMWHVWHYFERFVPEGKKAIEAVAAFIEQH
jgi:monoterpene epsilon-lactone hydrolase